MPRAIWTGSISFGLVNVPVKLFSATEDNSVSFRQFDPDSGERIRYQRVTEKSGTEVEYASIVKGYELEDGSHVLITPEELEAVEPGRSRTIDIEDFIDLDDVDPVYFDKTYHLAPADQAAAKPYALLREAMKESNRVAIARFVMRAKQHLGAIRVAASDDDEAGDVLVLETMHFGDEVRSPADIREMGVLADGIEISDRERAAATSLVESLTADWDPSRYADTYRERVLDLVARKAEGERIVVEAPEAPTASVTDLMAVLEASVNEARQKRTGAGAGRPAAESPPPSDGRDWSKLSKDELYEEAQRRDIDGRSKMTKRELVAALSGAGALAEAS